jgi:pimeloyl-ACP methyl ester carboxylesterase
MADAYGARLSHATVEHIPDAGHWPWLDQPRVIDLVADFVTQG